MSTIHIGGNVGDVAGVVIMPGDPLRAKYIADNFLENVICFNTIRNMFGYTGTYNGKRVSVMGSGMGMPSVGIYAYELFTKYNVEKIVRIGTCGKYTHDLRLSDCVCVTASYSDSSFAKTMYKEESDTLYASDDVVFKINECAKNLSVPIYNGKVYTSDVFYRNKSKEANDLIIEKGVAVADNETFGLFAVAKYLEKQVACLLTVSGSCISKESLSVEKREQGLNTMIRLALESV